ncbi:MAG TPA: hypothetical protein VK502_03005 [Candidatus Saccharimonadales bacterium]|nr:hypothetical protein [Candidatus Saccharimonadales bacterium]
MQPNLLVQQAERWQKEASPLKDQLQALKAALKSLEEKEQRYAMAYGEGDDVMPLRVYQDNMYTLNEKRANILSEIAAVEDELANKPTIPLEKLIDGVVKLVESLDFANKKQIIQKLVTKIIATKEEITIWGHIPLLATGQVGYDSINRYRWPSKRW